MARAQQMGGIPRNGSDRPRTMRQLAAAVACAGLTVLLLATTALGRSDSAEPPWPTERWVCSAPIDQNMSITALDEFCSSAGRYADTVLVVRNGYIVSERNASNFASGAKHFLFSTTKSILSILVGIAIDKGYIENVAQPVLDFFPHRSVANLDERKRSLTLEHLLTMTSGFDCCEDNNETFNRMAGSWDWLQFALDLPVTGTPGETFEYCNANSHLISCILTETTGLSAHDFAEAYLFGPLGIDDVTWNSDPQGRSIGCTGLWMKPRDLAKIGLLCLEGGRWDGEQVVSSSWIEASIQPRTACNDYGYRNGYGYQWWIGNESDGWYLTSGYQGQHLFVLPEQKIVVVFTGSNSQTNNNLFERFVRNQLLPALEMPSLDEQTAELTNVEPVPVPSLPETAHAISGRQYDLGPHTYLFETFTLTFVDDADEATFAFRRWGLDYRYSVGLDGVWRVNSAMGPDVRQYRAVRGAWIDEDTFRMEQIELDWGESWEMTLTFEQDRVHFVFASLPGTGSFRFETTGFAERSALDEAPDS